MRRSFLHRYPKSSLLLWMGLASAVFPGCRTTGTEPQSDVLTTYVRHTDVKRQAIGNCWLYAQATWLESMLLTATGEKLNASESYWTYWHWYEQIVDAKKKKIQTGGSWDLSAYIIRKHGFVLEGEFIAEEADVQMSARQDAALNAINTALDEGGSLAKDEDKTPANVRAALDKAFGVEMAKVEPKARKANETLVSRPQDPQVTLLEALTGSPAKAWQQEGFPWVEGKDTPVPEDVLAQRRAILVRVMKALNDHKPVVMSLMIDFNGLDPEDKGSFKYETLLKAGTTGRQGGHLLVLHDYVVKDVPGVGTIGEGEVNAELKAKALEGNLVYLIAKNSWGTDRPERGITDGYTRFYADYLFKQWEWLGYEGGPSSWYTTLSSFVLPPGY